MLTAYTVEQVRAAEERLMARVGDEALMLRAARGLAEAMEDVPAGAVVVMLIGPGNNGGDALFAATHLLDRGVRVDLCLLKPDAVHAAGLRAALAAGAQLVDEPSRQRVCVDALFGIGARPGLSGRAEQWASWVERERPFTVAVDVPSGVGVEDGTLDGPFVRADRVVTFGCRKPSSLLGPAAAVGGLPQVIDIGLAPELGAPDIEAIGPEDGSLLRRLAPSADAHKYTRGVVGVAAGSAGYAGAAHLCVAGAQAGPVGMVRFAGDDALAARIVDRAPEVVAASSVPASGRVQAWVVGPGAGDDVAERLREVLSCDVPVVVDAGALEHLPQSMPVPSLLTPHAGELARLLGVDRETVEADPWQHARAAADRWDATVLLKGSRTLVVEPGERGGRTRVNLTGSPWLATAGAGDVLAGLAGALLAAGASPLEAGSLAAYLHGAAADAANPGGPITASAVAHALPAALARFIAGEPDEGELR